MKKGVVLGIVAVIIIAGYLYIHGWYRRNYVDPRDPNGICIQVITHARNPMTGEQKDFGNPCQVPLGWR